MSELIFLYLDTSRESVPTRSGSSRAFPNWTLCSEIARNQSAAKASGWARRYLNYSLSNWYNLKIQAWADRVLIRDSTTNLPAAQFNSNELDAKNYLIYSICHLIINTLWLPYAFTPSPQETFFYNHRFETAPYLARIEPSENSDLLLYSCWSCWIISLISNQMAHLKHSMQFVGQWWYLRKYYNLHL